MKGIVLCLLMINAWDSSAKDFVFSFKLFGCSDEKELRCCATDLRNNITEESYGQTVFKINFVAGENLYGSMKMDYCKSSDTQGVIRMAQGSVEIPPPVKGQETKRVLNVVELLLKNGKSSRD